MIMELLTEKHPEEFNAQMVSTSLGISKKIALEIMEDLASNRFIKKVNIGRFTAINSRRKLKNASVKKSVTGVNVRGPYEGSVSYKMLEAINSHPESVYCHLGFSELFPSDTKASISRGIVYLCKNNLISKVSTGFFGSNSSDKLLLLGKVEAIKNLSSNEFHKAVYGILRNSDKGLTVKEIVNSLPPVSPFNKPNCSGQVERALMRLSMLGKIVHPEINKFQKRMLKTRKA